MSRALVERYGGELRFPKRPPYVFANFVSSDDARGRAPRRLAAERACGDRRRRRAAPCARAYRPRRARERRRTDPHRGRADALRSVPRGRCDRRALPHDRAASGGPITRQTPARARRRHRVHAERIAAWKAPVAEARGRVPLRALRAARRRRPRRGLVLRADLHEAALGDARLEAQLGERRRSGAHATVLHTEPRPVPWALDLAAAGPRPLALVERTAGVRALVGDRVDRAVELHDEDGQVLRLADDGFAVVEAASRDVELRPLGGLLFPRLAIHFGAVPVGHLATKERADEHDRPADP